MKTLQEVKYFQRYDKSNLIEFAEFEVMFSLTDTGMLECDHSKLDNFTKQKHCSEKEETGTDTGGEQAHRLAA